MTQIPTLHCPSDPGIGLPGQGRTNYAACEGDSTYRMDEGMQTRNNIRNMAGMPDDPWQAEHFKARRGVRSR